MLETADQEMAINLNPDDMMTISKIQLNAGLCYDQL